MATITDYDHGISAIDSGYGRPLHNAIHLIIEGGRAAVIDTGVNSSVPHVLAALRAKCIDPSQVDYVILTHIHLDHAGGAGRLMEELPQARLVVHPRGARHMIDPSRLIEGTIAVYGAQRTRELYGDIVAVTQDRVIEATHESTLSLNGREFTFFDTPGHARHHVCMLDARSGHVFAGDTFGLSYRELDRDGRQFIFPTTSPVQFDAQAEHHTLDLILGLRPAAVYVTHYSQVRNARRLGADMHRLLTAHEEMALLQQDSGAVRHERLRAGVRRIVLDEARLQQWPLTQEQLLALFAGDIELNAQGLAIWLDAQAAR